jgi:hypothetical protein
MKMAKIDIAKAIVEEFPDKGYVAEELKEQHTEDELKQLQTDLRNEGGQIETQEQSDQDEKTQTHSDESNDVQPKTVDLTPEEQTALDIQKAKASNESLSGQKYKLKDPNTSFNDPNFTLSGDQEKELPDDASPELISRIRSGFIVKA